jgi:hypothetical protein
MVPRRDKGELMDWMTCTCASSFEVHDGCCEYRGRQSVKTGGRELELWMEWNCFSPDVREGVKFNRKVLDGRNRTCH